MFIIGWRILQFLGEMVAAWQRSVDLRLGLFSEEREGVSPLAAHEGCILTPDPPYVAPHNVWIKFITERIEVAKYCSLDQVEMFCIMLHQCLPVAIGQNPASLSRHVTAVGTRFRYFSSVRC